MGINIDAEDLERSNISHKLNFYLAKKNLSSFFGEVVKIHNQLIAANIVGNKILDVGAGLGALSKYLVDLGYDVDAIDIYKPAIDFAYEFYGIKIKNQNIQSTEFPDLYFDCIILKEVISHLDFPKALKEINRICKKQLIIFESNPHNILLQFARRLINHRECYEREISYYTRELKENGYHIQKIIFKDIFLLAISGGVLFKQIFPINKNLYKLLKKIDNLLWFLLSFLKLNRIFCWRYLLVASKGVV